MMRKGGKKGEREEKDNLRTRIIEVWWANKEKMVLS